MTRKATIAAALAAALLAGCGKDGETPPPAEPSAAPAPVETDPVKARMKDPEYRKTLESLRSRSKDLRGEVIKARRALAEAKERGAAQEELDALNAEVARRERDFAENTLKANAVVGAQMRGDAGHIRSDANTNANNELHK